MLMQCQILKTDVKRNLQQSCRGIDISSLGIKGQKHANTVCYFHT